MNDYEAKDVQHLNQDKHNPDEDHFVKISTGELIITWITLIIHLPLIVIFLILGAIPDYIRSRFKHKLYYKMKRQKRKRLLKEIFGLKKMKKPMSKKELIKEYFNSFG